MIVKGIFIGISIVTLGLLAFHGNAVHLVGFGIGMAGAVIVYLFGSQKEAAKVSALQKDLSRLSDTITKDQSRISNLEAKTGFGGRVGLRN